jgi:hypothetical protein
MKYSDIVESQSARLGDFVTVKVNDPNADLWIVRRNSIDLVGEPKREYEKERIIPTRSIAAIYITRCFTCSIADIGKASPPVRPT